MKTTNYNKAIQLMFIFSLILNTAFSQTRPVSVTGIGFGAETFISCDGHGAFYSPYMSVLKGRNSFNMGPVIQKRSGIMNGVKISYSRNLSGDKVTNYGTADLFQLNFFSSLQYNGALPLSYSVIKYEERIVREPQPNFNTLKLSTVEMSSGFAFQLNFTQELSWKMQFGVLAYHHLNYAQVLDHQKTGVALNLGTSLCFVIH